MVTHAINRQTFEFSCASEDVAESLRFEVEQTISVNVNRIISSVLEELNDTDSDLEIDTIEIDLSDVSREDFGKADMLDEFKRLFKQKILACKSEKNYSIKHTGISNSTNNELELTQFFLLYGDVPWWADKNSNIELDAILQRVIQVYPESLRRLLERHREKLPVLMRIAEQYKLSSRLMIEAMISPITNFKSKNLFNTSHSNPVLLSLSTQEVSQLQELFEKFNYNSYHRLSHLLISAIEKKINWRKLQILLPELYHTGISSLLLNKKLAADELSRKIKDDIKAIILKLNIFQIEFLLLEMALPDDDERYTGIPSASNSSFHAKSSLEPRQDINEDNAVPGIFSDQPGSKRFLVDEFRPEPVPTANGNVSTEMKKNHLAVKPVQTEIDLPSSNENSKISDEIHAFPDSKLNQENHVEKTNDSGNSLQDIPTNDQNNLIFVENESVTKPIELIDGQNPMTDLKDIPIHNKEDSQIVSSKNDLTQSLDSAVPASLHPFERKISFVMTKLGSDSSILLDRLQKLTEKQLDDLMERFKNHITEKRNWGVMIKKILDHPYFLKYNILGLFANLSFSDLSQSKADRNSEIILLSYLNKIQISQSDFLSFINELPLRDLVVLKDIFQKKVFESNHEKKIVRKMLHKLSGEAVTLLKYLTELSEEKIQQMSDSGNKALTVIKGPENIAPEPMYNDDGERKIIIENAGLCLVANYLPGFFKRLNYLENRIFKNEVVANRALYLLQNIVTGRSKNPEYLLQLNKLICGFEVDDTIIGSVRLTKTELSEIEGLLSSVIEHWTKLKATSINGFRESFLQRKGILVEKESSWTLTVERKSYDLLLSTIPWSFSIIKLPWMKKHIQVEW